MSEQTPALSQKYVLECIWTDIPDDVYEEVKELWAENEFGNDNYYYDWYTDSDEDNYPKIAAYLIEHGITECLIHYWW